MIKAIAHICISTKDLDETERFYCSCLGLSKKFDFIRDGKVFGYYLQINDNNFIEVFQTDANSSEEEPQVKHFCLEVDDIDRTIEERSLYSLRIRGTSITSFPCKISWRSTRLKPGTLIVKSQVPECRFAENWPL